MRNRMGRHTKFPSNFSVMFVPLTTVTVTQKEEGRGSVEGMILR